MASAWGASWGSAWGDSWGSLAVFIGGGYPSAEARRKRIYEQRVALGILPAPVKRAIRAAVRRVVKDKEPPKQVLVQELERREVAYQPDYLEALRRSVAIAAAFEREQQERTRKRHRTEEELLVMLM